MIEVGAEGSPVLLVSGALLWMVAGAVVAWALAQRGHAMPASALLAWPFLLPALLGRRGDRVDEALDALSAALTTAGSPELCDTAALRRALRAAERRLAELGRLRRESAEVGDPALLAEVDAALERTRAEVDGVLLAVQRLRIQLGMAGLAGPGSLGETLAGLRARVAALGEVERVGRGVGG
jgi:hypothetical protein